MSTNDKKFDDFEILMVYLNESDDPKLTDEILSSQQGCEQLESLQKDMNIFENKINNYNTEEEYGVGLWNKISDRLDEAPRLTWFQKFIKNMQQPQFSAVGLVAMFAIAATFYLLGQNQAVIEDGLQQVSNQKPPPNQQLLAQNMQIHLAQTDMFLTQLSNMQSQQNSPVLIKTAESLLASNRIYKSAFANKDNKRLQNLLSELEQVLTEVSNGQNQHTQKYISDYANNQLLYKVKSSNQQLKAELSNQQTTSI